MDRKKVARLTKLGTDLLAGRQLPRVSHSRQQPLNSLHMRDGIVRYLQKHVLLGKSKSVVSRRRALRKHRVALKLAQGRPTERMGITDHAFEGVP